MTQLACEIRPGAYYDSVVLMQLQRALAALDGVQDAGVVMGTPANQELLAASDLLPPAAAAARADDLLIVIRASAPEQAAEALSQVDSLLQRRRSDAGQDYRPRSLNTAVKNRPEAAWVLISVPGQYAGDVAQGALDLGRHVFLYSDNVPVETEVKLKQAAQAQGLLVMGPDCGTAIVNGVGLGFANRVRRGDIGLIAASGTGLQAVTSQIHRLGGGVSQALGTGGRDLAASVGAITTRQALDLLARDPGTRVIVLISKPPAPAVAAAVLAQARGIAKPVVVEFIGYPPPARQLGNLHFAAGLDEAASLALALRQEQTQTATAARASVDGYLRGLFSGGTLAYEAVLGLQASLAPLYSNVPVRPDQALEDPLHSQGHTILDLGEDQFTQGRLHPMMDNDLRLRRLRQEAADPATGLILLDVVLGEGAHPDPAGELAPAIAAIRAERSLPVVVMLIGTDEDPQDLEAQAARLVEAGATVFRESAAALAHVAGTLGPPHPFDGRPVSLDAFAGSLTAINVGLESFHDSLVGQGAAALQVEWRPPAGGNARMAELLARLKSAQ